MRDINEPFDTPLKKPWHEWMVGNASITVRDSTMRMALGTVNATSYANAQLDDYGTLHIVSGRRRRLPLLWKPPLRLRVRARASHDAWPKSLRNATAPSGAYLRGTAGFGFWNAGLSPGGQWFSLPDAVWFFAASRPSDMALVPGSPGWGWKAQVVRANRLATLATGLPTLAAVALSRLGGPVAPAERMVQRLTGASESHLDINLRGWHDYELEWQPEVVLFRVDGAEVLCAPNPPQGPLGFVAWVDNQFAVATPRGELRFGYVNTTPQWLEVDQLEITSLA